MGIGRDNPAMTRDHTHTSEEAAASAVRSLPSTFGTEPVKQLPPPDMKYIRAQLEGMTAKTWKKVREDLLAAMTACDR